MTHEVRGMRTLPEASSPVIDRSLSRSSTVTWLSRGLRRLTEMVMGA
jgi:hypothetical protein